MNAIYFDNASTSWPKAPGVGACMCKYIEEVGCNTGRGGYQKAYEVSAVVYDARENIRCLFNGNNSKNVVFTANVTQAINTVIKGYLKQGDHVLVSGLEHNAVIRPLEHLKSIGISYDILPCDIFGNLEIKSLQKKIKKETKAVVMTHGSNVCGAVLPIREVGAFCKEKGIAFIIDAAQTAGIIPIDMETDNIDALCFTGHKGLRGPQGIGGIVFSEKMTALVAPFIEGGTGSVSDSMTMPVFMPDRFEAGTLNLAGIYGLNTALNYLEEVDVEALLSKENQLTAAFIEGIKNIDMLKLIGSDSIENRCPVVSVTCERCDLSEIAFELDRDYGIMTRVGLHCAPIAHRTLGTYPNGTLRFSFSPSNTFEEIERTLSALKQIEKE